MSSRLDVILPIFSENVQGKSFTATGQNPGVGGTQYVSILLSLLLARRFPELQLRVINQIGIVLPDAPPNLTVELENDINEFLRSMEPVGGNFVIILPVSLLRSAETALVEKFREHIVGWVHHPFQFDYLVQRLRLVAQVHVGEFQYYSNSSFYNVNWHINNPFVLPDVSHGQRKAVTDPKIRVVYLGALVKVKGFGHLARQWSAIKNVLPEVELHIIGSSATYGKPPEHRLIPCDLNFAEEILSHIPLADIEEGKVVFHGNLGQEKFEIMRSAHFAILNPTGASEAFPASPLECMACGLPVIASDDYGMSDSMRFFPELILRTPEDIPARVQFLMEDQYRYEELSARSTAVAAWFDGQTNVILARWRRLFELVGNGRQRDIPHHPPIGSLYGSRLKLRMRQMRVRLGALKRASVKMLKNA